MTKRGAFILFEGLDRCGKSTQCKQLIVNLTKNGQKCIRMDFPDRTTQIGQMLDSYLRNTSEMDDHAVHLLFSANRWELKKKILLNLKKGHHIICARYAYSGIAFSASKGLDLEWCKAPDIGLPKPDVIFFLSIPAKGVAERKNFGAERYETVEIQSKVKTFFELLKKSDNAVTMDATKKSDVAHADSDDVLTPGKKKKQKCIEDEKTNNNLWKEINAAQNSDVISTKILKMALKVIDRVKNLPIGTI